MAGRLIGEDNMCWLGSFEVYTSAPVLGGEHYPVIFLQGFQPDSQRSKFLVKVLKKLNVLSFEVTL